MGVINKIKFLLKLRKENNDYYQYVKNRYLNKRMPKERALKIKDNTFSLVNKGELLIDTYDFSNQLVHPDICYFKNKYWMTATPYPFGMDEYENPVIYNGDDLNNLKLYKKNPIALPSKNKIGDHLSDPCFGFDKNIIFLIYRESIRQKNKKEINILYKYDIDGDNNPKVLCSSYDDYLSPAVLTILDKSYLYFANKYNNATKLYLSDMGNELTNIREINCVGLPDSYYVWHMGVNFKDDLSKYSDNNKEITGILLLKSTEKKPFKVALFDAKDINSEWVITDILDDYGSLNIMHPYKCSLIPNSNKIAFSFRDVDNHYRICILDKEELAHK